MNENIYTTNQAGSGMFIRPPLNFVGDYSPTKVKIKKHIYDLHYYRGVLIQYNSKTEKYFTKDLYKKTKLGRSLKKAHKIIDDLTDDNE